MELRYSKPLRTTVNGTPVTVPTEEANRIRHYYKNISDYGVAAVYQIDEKQKAEGG